VQLAAKTWKLSSSEWRTQHVRIAVSPSVDLRYGLVKTARRVVPRGNFEAGPKENQVGGGVWMIEAKMNPINGIPIRKAATVLSSTPTCSKKSRLVEYFLASGLDGGWSGFMAL
jgi:hypothetical protein